MLAPIYALQRLSIGVGANELHPLDTRAHHVVNGIAATAPDTDQLDDRRLTV
jgi:hypothetical protein